MSAYNCGIHWHPTRETAIACENKRQDEKFYGRRSTEVSFCHNVPIYPGTELSGEIFGLESGRVFITRMSKIPECDFFECEGLLK